MAPSAKRKQKVIDDNNSKVVVKRKCNNAGRKLNHGIVQFFTEVVDVDKDDASDNSLFGDDFFEDEFCSGNVSGTKVPNEFAEAPVLPFVTKKKQITKDQSDKMLEERCKLGSAFVTSTENYENKRSIETSTYMPSAKDPVIWKVKCKVGNERRSLFCLMQKYVHLKYLGTTCR